MFVGKVKQAYNIIGRGVCNFGSYSIQGSLHADNTLQIYKIYDVKAGATPSVKRRKSSEGSSKRLPTTPRESTPRSRCSMQLMIFMFYFVNCTPLIYRWA